MGGPSIMMKTFGRILRFDNTEILMVESGHHIEQKMTWFCAVAQNIVIINENWLELEIDYDYNGGLFQYFQKCK